MNETLSITVTFTALSVVTYTISMIVPGFVGAVTPFPISFGNVVGISVLATPFVALAVVLFVLGQLSRDTRPETYFD